MAESPNSANGQQTARYVPLRKQRSRPEAKMQPPLTPIIDVTFQLLIFFLVTFQIRLPEGMLPASLPAVGLGAREPPPMARSIRIGMVPTGIAAEGVLYEVGALVTPDPNELWEELVARKNAAGTDQVPVEIRPVQDVKWRFVVEAFNAAVRAKLKKVAFASSART